jgi:hypothetical protein
MEGVLTVQAEQASFPRVQIDGNPVSIKYEADGFVVTGGLRGLVWT